MNSSRKPSRTLPERFEAAAAAVLETTAIAAYFASPTRAAAGHAVLIVAHVLAAMLGTRAAMRHASRGSGPDRGMKAWLWFGLAVLLPGLGLFFVLGFIPAAGSDAKRREEKYIIGRADVGETGRGPRTNENQSFMQIMSGTDTEARRRAVLAMRHVDAKLVVPVLRRTLRDSDEQVRLFSQQILNQIVDEVECRVSGAEEALKTGNRSVERLVRLAESYHEAVYLELLTDENARRGHLQKALSALRTARDEEPENCYVLTLLLRYSLEAGEWKPAEDYLRQLKQLEADQAMVLPWELELAYEQRNWPVFAAILAEHGDSLAVHQRLNEVRDFWLNPA